MLRSRQGLQRLNVWGSLRCWDTRRVRLLVVDLRLWHGLGEVHGDQFFFFHPDHAAGLAIPHPMLLPSDLKARAGIASVSEAWASRVWDKFF